MAVIGKLCGKQPAPARIQLGDEEAMVVNGKSEKHREVPLSSIFQRLVTLCAGNRESKRSMGHATRDASALTTLQVAEFQLERMTNIDIKADIARERQLGFFALHFGTAFLVGNWVLFLGCAVYAAWVAHQFRGRCQGGASCAWAGLELLGAMLFTAGGLALVQSAYPQRLRQFMLIMMQPQQEAAPAHRYLYGTWVVLGNALWGMASVVWLIGALVLFANDVLLASLSGQLQGGCTAGLGALSLAAVPLPCSALSALELLVGYSALAAFFVSGWYISLEDSLRLNDGQGSGRCWDYCCTSDWCRRSYSCQTTWRIDMKAWANVFQAVSLALQVVASVALPFNLYSSTAWLLFCASHLVGVGFFIMVDAQEKIVAQMTYAPLTQ